MTYRHLSIATLALITCAVLIDLVFSTGDKNSVLAQSDLHPASGWIDIGAENLGLHDRTKCLANETLYQFEAYEYDDETPLSGSITMALATRDKTTNTPIANVVGGNTAPELCFDVDRHILGVSINGGGTYHNFNTSVAWAQSDDSAFAKGRIIKGHIHLKRADRQPDIELIGPLSGYASTSKPRFAVVVRDVPALSAHNVSGVAELKVIAQNMTTFSTYEARVTIAGGPGTYYLDTLSLPNGTYRWGAYVGLNGRGVLSRPPNPKSGWAGWATIKIDTSPPQLWGYSTPSAPDYTQLVSVVGQTSDGDSFPRRVQFFINDVQYSQWNSPNHLGSIVDYPYYMKVGPFPGGTTQKYTLVATNGAGLQTARTWYSTTSSALNLPDFVAFGYSGFNYYPYDATYNTPRFDCDTEPNYVCSSYEAEKPLYVHAGFRNVGQAAATGPFYIRTTIDVYNDGDTSNDVTFIRPAGGTTNPWMSWNGLSGEYRFLVAEWPNPPAGATHAIREVCMDAPDAAWSPGNPGLVTELLETNNCYSYPTNPPTVTVRPPVDPLNAPLDLSVKSLSLTYATSTRYVGDVVTLHARIKNEIVAGTSGTTSPPTVVRLADDRYYGGGQYNLFATPVTPSLAPGEEVVVSGTVTIQHANTRYLQASLPPDYNLGNNSLGTTDTFSPRPAGLSIGEDIIDPNQRPDLVTENVQAPGGFISGRQVNITARTKNSDFRNGASCAPSCASSMDAGVSVSVLRDKLTGTWLDAANVPALDAGENRIVTFSSWVPRPGQYELEICADYVLGDPEGVIEELSELNNCHDIGAVLVVPQCKDSVDNDSDTGTDHATVVGAGVTPDDDCTSADEDDEEGDHYLMLNASRRFVQYGQTVDLMYSASDVGTCTVRSSQNWDHATDADASDNVPETTVTTEPITRITTFTLRCQGVSGNLLPDIATSIVNVAPRIKQR